MLLCLLLRLCFLLLFNEVAIYCRTLWKIDAFLRRAHCYGFAQYRVMFYFINHDNDVYELRNVTHVTQRVMSVETSVVFFAVCGPMFASLSEHAQQRLHFATLLATRHLVSEVVRN